MMNRAPAAQEISIHVLENGPFDPSTMCIHELFEARAQAAPDAVAATSGGDAITYGELNRRANRLAHRLIEAGVTQGAPVGVFVERSLAILVALLGILKAGGAYLPLDAKFPRERLERMLADSGTKVLLTERARAEELSFNGDVISPEESAGAAEQNPTRRGTPGSPAYVMFTSGSTGRPKGVVIPHGAVVGLVVRTNYVDIRPSDRVAHVSNLAFDASTFEIWGALLNGARVIILPNEVLLSPGALAAAVRREGVTVMFITAAFFHQLASVDATAFAGLKYLLVGGDACDPRWVREVLAGSAPGALLNAYGPTESTTFSTFHRVIDVPPDATTVPIGRPVSGTTTHVLGPDLRPVSRGAAGELYLGGDRLAVGYLNQPEITAQKFIADPFSSAPGARLYRTGDWVRELPDGTLVFIGRTDNQIKIRGHRIELGEIEAALRQHPSVAATVVTVREDVPGDKRITAYIVPPRGRAPAIADLRRALRESLPAIMVPSAFVVLERLPATPNGKVDIAALPPPSRDSGEAGDMVEPRSATEARLARAYAEILGLQEVGAEDDFFGLGGSSLAVVRLLARIRKEFNVELPSRCIYESPRVMDLAAVIDAGPGPLVAPTPARLDLRALAVLDPTIRPSGSAAGPARSARDIFLTGATGFLGAFLLRELLRETGARIHCLVRAADPTEGMSRIQATLQKYSLWDQRLSARIRPVPGDLARPLLGLSPERFDALAATIGAIYHSAAEVSYIKPYAQHEAANVRGTHEIIRLACRGRATPLHYVSTIAVFGHIGWFTGRRWIREDDDIDAGADHLHTDIGYSQSKWVAEKLVWLAKERGLPVTIFRPGFILGHSRTGAINESDFMCRMTKSCIQLGAFPDLPDQSKEIVPVDFVSRAIAHLSRKKSSPGKVFHLVPPPSQRLDLMSFFGLLRGKGYSLQRLPYGRWIDALLARIEVSGGDPLLPLLPMLTEPVQAGPLTRWELYRHMPTFACENTLAGLAGTAIACPAMSAELLDTYLLYLARIGFLEAPPRGPVPKAIESRPQRGDPQAPQSWRRVV